MRFLGLYELNKSECEISILKALVGKKNCILKYGDSNEEVSDMLKSICNRLEQRTTQTNSENKISRKKSMDEKFRSDPIDDSKLEEICSFNIEGTDRNYNEPVNIQYYSHHQRLRRQSSHEVIPELNAKKLRRVDTLRVK